jgi:hypothetical protein
LSCMDSFWHPECFLCHACNIPIDEHEVQQIRVNLIFYLELDNKILESQADLLFILVISVSINERNVSSL